MNKIEYMNHHGIDCLDMSRIMKCLELGGKITNIQDGTWEIINAEYIAKIERMTKP